MQLKIVSTFTKESEEKPLVNIDKGSRSVVALPYLTSHLKFKSGTPYFLAIEMSCKKAPPPTHSPKEKPFIE